MFSIILPTFNRWNSLQRAIKSVFEQSYPHWELHIIDDGSTDQTKDFQISDSRIFVHHLKKNQGPAAARNYGLKKAKGDWLAFLDSDDVWHADKLQESFNFINKNSYFVFQSQDVWLKDQKRIYPKKKHQKQSGDILTMATKLCPVSMSSVLVHRNIFEDLGVFNESYPVCEDYDFWLRVATKYKFGLLDKELVTLHAGHSGRVSQKDYFFDEWRIQSLLNVLKNYSLTEKQKQILKEQLLNKYQILSKGYKKYQKLEQLKKLEKSIQEFLTPF